MRLSLATALAAATLAAVTSVCFAGSNDDERAIRHAVDTMNEAFNRHDEAVARRFMTEDADYVNVRGSWPAPSTGPN